MHDFLLNELDLPAKNEDYFKVISKKDFIKTFGDSPIIRRYSFNLLKRVAIVLPLHISDSHVIPIPFIVDTGAPYMYLGSGAIKKN